LAGVYGSVTVSAGEGGTTAGGFTRGDGFRLGWIGGGFHVAAAQFTTRNAAAGQRFKDQVLGGSYDFAFVKIDVAQRRWVLADDRTVNTHLGALIPIGQGELKLSIVHADQTGATEAQSANDATLIGAGYVYNLSKRTALYTHMAQVSNKSAATFAIPGGPAVSANPNAPNFFGGQKSSGFEAGLRHHF
jgi:predicted porin